MSLEQVQEELYDGGLHTESVDRLLDHYQSMESRFQEGEYDEAGTHIGNFCENIVNLLRDQMGEDILNRPKVGKFVDNCKGGKFGNDEPASIRIQIPNMLRSAYDIRNNRDSVHVNLRVPVNQADTQAGIAICSWILAEIVRVYGDGNHSDDMEEVANLIDELSEPVLEGNPLTQLETSHDDFDREAVLSVLENVIQIAEGEVKPARKHQNLDSSQQVTALLLGCRVAVDLGHLETAYKPRSWLEVHVDVGGERVRQIVTGSDFIEKNDSHEYAIPGYRVTEAVNYLKKE